MVHISLRRPILGGIIFAIILVISSLTFVEITGIFAREILATSVSGIISLCYVISIGSIYILVIILHLLSARIPQDMETDSRHNHFKSLLNIARLATLLIIFSIVVILVLSIPFTHISIFPDSMYSKIYYLILAVASVLGGSFISIITMIYLTIRNMIFHKDGQLSLNLDTETEEEELKEMEDDGLKSNKKVEKLP